MYAAIRQYQVAGSVDEVTRGINEGFLPLIKEAPGFHAYYALDAGGGRLATVSVFADRAGAEESNRMAADWAGRNMASLLPNPPEIVQGEVGVHEEAASGGPLSAATDTMGGSTDTVGRAASGVTDTVGGVTSGLTGGLLGGEGDKEEEEPRRRER